MKKAGCQQGKTADALRAELKRFADGLAGPSPTPLERTLADTAALSWFALRTFEAQYLASLNDSTGITLSQSEHHQRRIDRAHRRLLTTIRTLATVRRLGVPAIQVNVASQQVNLAGST